MSVSSGGVSTVTEQHEPDLNVIYQGGKNFLARMELFAKRRDDAETALLNLQLGQEAQAAREEATSLSAAATQDRAAAATVLADAQARAQAIVKAAEETADSLVMQARDAAEAIGVGAVNAKAAADAIAADTKAKAQKILADAQAQMESANRTFSVAAQAQEAAEALKTEAQRAQAKADAIAFDLTDRLEKLAGHIDGIVRLRPSNG